MTIKLLSGQEIDCLAGADIVIRLSEVRKAAFEIRKHYLAAADSDPVIQSLRQEEELLRTKLAIRY